MAASSSSASSSTVGRNHQHGNRNAGAEMRVSDLLVKDTGKDFAAWVSKVAKQDERERLELTRVQRMIHGAQVSAWQCLALGKMKSTGAAVPGRLPTEVRAMIAEFLGEVPSAERSGNGTDAHDLRRISWDHRCEDILSATRYYLQLLKESAERGESRLSLTEATYNAAPTLRTGEKVLLGLVFQVLEKRGFAIFSSDGEDFGNADFDDEDGMPDHFPFEVVYDEGALHDEAFYDSTDFMQNQYHARTIQTDYVTDFVSGRLDGLEAGTSRSKGGGTKIEIARTNRPSLFFDKYVEALRSAVDKAAAYVVELAMEQAFSRGDAVFTLTQEHWDGAPKLPNGKAAPFFSLEAEGLRGPYLSPINLRSSGVKTVKEVLVDMNDIDITVRFTAGPRFPVDVCLWQPRRS